MYIYIVYLWLTDALQNLDDAHYLRLELFNVLIRGSVNSRYYPFSDHIFRKNHFIHF